MPITTHNQSSIINFFCLCQDIHKKFYENRFLHDLYTYFNYLGKFLYQEKYFCFLLEGFSGIVIFNISVLSILFKKMMFEIRSIWHIKMINNFI